MKPSSMDGYTQVLGIIYTVYFMKYLNVLLFHLLKLQTVKL